MSKSFFTSRASRLAAGAFGWCAIASMVQATPLPDRVNLPFSAEDALVASERLDELDLANFTTFIHSLSVHPDHLNQKVESGSSAELKYYISPYLQGASSSQASGGQFISDHALELLSETRELTEAFNLNTLRLLTLNDEIKNSDRQILSLQNNLGEGENESFIRERIEHYEEQRVRLMAERDQLLSDGASGISAVDIEWRREIANTIRLRLAVLGVVADEAEQAALAGSDPHKMVDVISEMLLRASQYGHYGSKFAHFRSGFTGDQRRYISLYRELRPEVTLVPLNVSQLRVVPTSLSTYGLDEQTREQLGVADFISSNRLYLGANAASGGVCGGISSCNVVLDLTYLGAYTARAAVSGVISFPVAFAGEVRLIQPAFKGTVSCDFETGWRAKGRTDVRDGMVIYNGDVTNRMHFSSFENGDCEIDIEEGDRESAAYYTLHEIYNRYMLQRADYAAASRKAKIEYENHVRREIQEHADRSQQGRTGLFNCSYTLFGQVCDWVEPMVREFSWVTGAGSWIGPVVGGVVSSSRGFYWHTRIEDTSSIDRVNFSTTISEKNISAKEFFVVDGNTNMCWNNDIQNRFLTRCAGDDFADARRDAETDIGALDELCGVNFDFSTCNDLVDMASEN